ncbi:MAG TPA: DUF5134 domain-containing protein [Solirubrobacteraceae bacterium]|nr:DUF5134 domain-containing protein [Solirubrobacteraceae bacterium]
MGNSMKMNGMSMSSHGAHHAMGMTMGGVHIYSSSSGTNILPNWLAVIWTLAFIVIVVIHARHVMETDGQRRLWHSGHVLMAAGMIFMFAPATLNHIAIPSGFWPLLFANAALIIIAGALAMMVSGRAINMLWGIMAIDMGAMAYMWSPSGFVAPITWLLVAYFVVGAALWATNRMRGLDRHRLFGGVTFGADGTAAVGATAVEPLVCEHDLRGSMAVMALGMAYMLAAMQLML